MRMLLYFRIKDAATAQLAQMRLGELAGTPARVAGPWFGHPDNQPVDGLRMIDVSQTTNCEEAGITGVFVGGVVGALVIFSYGTSVGVGATAVAYVGAVVLCAIVGWWIGELVGGKIRRLGLWRHSAQAEPGELLMIAGCDSQSKEVVKQIIKDLGGVVIDGHSDLMPKLRWI